MRDRIFALLGVEPGEESMVSMLLTQSIFLGVFFGAFDISAHSLFLSIFDEKMMAKAYVLSGIAGIILTSLYTWLQTKLSFKKFAVANLFTVTLLTLLLWFGLLMTKTGWIVFLVFIMLGPLNILAALGFWGTAGRLFTLRQGKRLFGLVDSGLVAGIIVSCYTIPVVLSFNFESHNILLICAFAVFAATFLQMLIGSRFNLVSVKKADVPKEEPSVLSVIKKDRYIAIMALFVALSVMTAFFVQYSFMAVTRQQYPSEEDMARFLGIFTGSMMIFTLLVKLLAFSYLIRNYGIKVTLTLSPILVSILAAIAILIGLTMGYTPAAASGFLIFFLILALSRLFSKSLKDSIESPSFKVIYQTIDEKVRFEVQSAMDGTVNEIAALLSGLLLAGLGMLSFIKLIHFSVVLLVIILLWIFTAFLLYSEYRKSIRRALEATAAPDEKPVIPEGVKLQNRFSAEYLFRRDYFRLISDDILQFEKNQGNLYFENIIRQSTENNDINLIPVLRKISVDDNIDAEIRRKSEAALKEVEKNSGNDGGSRSLYARKILSGTRVPQTAEILRLLRDNSVESKRFAIYIIGKFRIADMLTEVCNCLGNPSLEADASAVLLSFGNDATEELQRYYMAVSGNTSSGISILRILSKIQSNESSSFLFSRLWSQSRRIKETAAQGLQNNRFIPSDEEKDRLNQLISDIIAIMTWNLAARVSIQKNFDTGLLGILDKDIERWKKFLFDLLSVAYDPVSIRKIKENLDKDTVESGNFALEMIDIVIDESLKPKIMALLDLVPDETKLKNLWHFFPGEIHPYEKTTENIINRDYNLLTVWTKACTLKEIESISNGNIAESVSALLFSPETIMQEEAVRLMKRSDEKIYSAVSDRLPVTVHKRLDLILKNDYKDEDLIYEKVLFLSKIFCKIPEDELLSLSEKLIYTNNLNDRTRAAECIAWDINDIGSVYIDHYNENRTTLKPGSAYYILPLASIDEFCRQYPERIGEILEYMDLNEIQN
ncbi:MAG TPA: hypothetical protein VHO46_00835 [Bacteroidales bacterium]|nr:hypothetical protein [Bacteroidales bacterium]